MKNWVAIFLLSVFMGFIACLTVNYGTYLKILNGGNAVEDVSNTMPEEHHEKSQLDEKGKNFHFHNSLCGLLLVKYSAAIALTCTFSLQENLYFDVPFSPPENYWFLTHCVLSTHFLHLKKKSISNRLQNQ